MFSRRWSKKLRLEGKRLRVESLESRIVMSASAVTASPLPAVEPASVQTSASVLSTEEWVHSLVYYQFNQLSPEDIQYLLPAQVATIPSTSYFSAISAQSRAAFNAAQVRALNVADIRINLLTPQQIGYLTVAQIQTLPTWDFAFLAPAQIPSLTSSQIASINSTAVLNSWTAAARAALTTPQVQSLNMSLVRTTALTATQLSWLTPAQIQSLVVYDLSSLSPSQIPHLSTAQIASIPSSTYFGSWSAAARAALTATQIRAINPAALSASQFTPEQVGYLTTVQIQSLPMWEFELLSPAQIPSLTSSQIASINSTAVLNSWTAAARAALTMPQVRSLNMSVVRTTALTVTQISWLTVAQIRSLEVFDLNLLSPSQIPYLTTTQIAAIPSSTFFGAWTASARAALTASQIQAIRPAALSASQLTPQQIGYLTIAQVQSLSAWEFVLLTPAQIPSLTSSQVASINSTSVLNSWSAAARAALTMPQVRSLNMSVIRTSELTETQLSWLTAAQIQSLENFDLDLLSPSQIPFLSTAQISSITASSTFGTWSAAARAALTAPQIQAIRPDALSASQFTALQHSYLTIAQIQSLPAWDLEFLNLNQVPFLTLSQVGSIQSLVGWSTSALASLTFVQVRVLNVASTGISRLTSTQVSWLTSVQLQSLPYFEFTSLHAWQIPALSTTQFAPIPASGFLHALSDASKAALTREQLLSLRPDVLSSYTMATVGPSNYHPATHMPIGPDGLPTMPHSVQEAAKFFALVPLDTATHVTVASGDWGNPAVWNNGVVPGAGARVVVSAGTTVRFNAYMNVAIDTLRIDGKLHFATNQNTQLKVDTVVVTTTGVLHVGTEAAPIQSNVTARILIADAGPINLTRDPHQLGRGVISRGEVKMHGMAVTPYATLAQEPMAGDTKLHLSAPPTNWRVGDRLVVTGTVSARSDFAADEVEILAINGSEVTITPLRYSHETPAGYGLSIHVANLNRNVQLVAEDPTVIAERPHMVFFQNPNVSIDNISVDGFGRTDKTVPVTDPVVVNGVLQPGTGANPRARYAMHFHHTGVNPAYAPATVRGSVVVGSPGWGYVNHSSNVDFEDNVAYNVVGAAFASEDGNEIGSMRRNLAINTTGGSGTTAALQNNHDFGTKGHGFWFQGPGIEVVDNIAAGSANSGFSYFTSSSKNLFDAVNLEDPSLAAGHEAIPVGLVPLKEFSGNTAYAGRVGLDVWHHLTRMTDGQTFIDDFTSWNNRVSGIEIFYAARLTIRNATLIGDIATPSGTGFFANRYSHDVTFENLHAAGLEVGVVAPVRGATVVSGGYFSAIQAIYIEKGHDARRSVDINGAITFAALNASQLQGRRQYSVYMSSNVDYAGQASISFYSFFTPDVVFFRPDGGPVYRLYYYLQSRGYMPFSAAAMGSVPKEYINLRNAHLSLFYGKVFAGEQVSQYNTFEIPGVFGLLR